MVDKKKFAKETEKKVKEGSKKLYPVSDKDIDIVKGDSSESGTNSYAKSTQAAVKALSKILYSVCDKDIETLKD